MLKKQAFYGLMKLYMVPLIVCMTEILLGAWGLVNGIITLYFLECDHLETKQTVHPKQYGDFDARGQHKNSTTRGHRCRNLINPSINETFIFVVTIPMYSC